MHSKNGDGYKYSVAWRLCWIISICIQKISQHSNLNIYICIQSFIKAYYNVPGISVNQFVCCMHARMHLRTHMYTHTTHAHTRTHTQTHKHEHAYIHTPHNTRACTHQLLSLNLLSPNKSGDKLLLSNFWWSFQSKLCCYNTVWNLLK